MTARIRFGIGPLRFSYRLTRTQAQKRAAARQRQARHTAPEARKFDPREYIRVTETATSVEIKVYPSGLSPAQGEQVLALAEKLQAEYRLPLRGQQLTARRRSTPERSRSSWQGGTPSLDCSPRMRLCGRPCSRRS
jgi:hypothetical protein